MPFVRRHRKYYKYGTEPNASIVGSFARIDKGVASGFSSANYLTLSEAFTPSSNTWEQVYKITTGSDVSTNQIFVGNGGAANKIMCGVQSGKFKLWLSSNNSTWNVADASTGSYTVLSSTEYYIRLKFTGTSYTLEYSLNGNEDSYATDITVSSSALITNSNALSFGANQYGSGVNHPFLGSIDLSQSYININGSRWWSGDEYTKVGSWIDDGVVSGFTTGNYLTTPNILDLTSANSWELVTRFTHMANGVLRGFAGLQTGTDIQLNFYINDNNALCSDGVWGNLESSTSLVVGQTYYSKLTYTGTSYILSLSTDGTDYTVQSSIDSSVKITAKATVSYGKDRNVGYLGTTDSIDLNQSYIKINGKEWWHGTKAYQVNLGGEDIWEDWKQPTNMTAKGTMGGSSFAVAQSSSFNSNDFWKLFASSPSDWHSAAGLPQWVSWYNPKPLKVTKLYFPEKSSGQLGDFIIQACDDNSSWVNILSYSNTDSTVAFEVDLSSNDKAYKYWRIYITSCYYIYKGAYYPLISAGFTITAQTLKAVGSNDYDYYVNHNKLYQLAAVKRSYWKYQDWEQPILTENGTMGGDKFAVSASSEYGGTVYACLAFSGVTNDYWHSNSGFPQWISWYNPNPLKITNVKVTNRYTDGSYPNAYQLQYSDNNSTWTTVVSGNGTSGDSVSWDIPVTHDTAHEYWRLYVTSASGSNSGYVAVGEIVITAQEEVIGTSTDYDYYTDKLLSYAPIVRGKRSYYKQDLSQRDTGTYTFTLAKDYTAKMLFVGNGGGGCTSQKDSRWHYSSGGSGACFEGLVRLPADTYTLTIGSLGYGNNANNTHYHSSSVVSTDSFLTNSAGQELIRVGAGGNGYTSVGGVGGAAGVLTMGALDVVETKKATDGVYTAGNTAAGSVSAYDGTYSGYGAGTCGQRGAGNVYGIKGIFDLVLETDINDFDWYEDVGTKIY